MTHVFQPNGKLMDSRTSWHTTVFGHINLPIHAYTTNTVLLTFMCATLETNHFTGSIARNFKSHQESRSESLPISSVVAFQMSKIISCEFDCT